MKRAFLLWLLAMVGSANGAPKIEFDRPVYDFGTTSLVESVTGTFTFTNTGDGVLKLEKPKPSCGCTVARVSSETLQPGEKGELVFTIKLGTSAQQLAKEIFVASNDPLNPVVRLDIKVAVKNVFETQPPGVSFEGIHVGSSTNMTVLVRRLDGKKLVVTRTDATSELINATVEPVENSDGKSARIHVEVKAEGLPRLLSEQLRLYTADSIGPAVAIFVRGHLLGDIQIEPEELVLGMPDPNNWPDPDPEVVLSRSITITSVQTERALVVRNVSCSLKEFTVKLVTLKKGRQYEVVATLPKRLSKPLHGTISFETNLPSLPKVEVPLTVDIWTP